MAVDWATCLENAMAHGFPYGTSALRKEELEQEELKEEGEQDEPVGMHKNPKESTGLHRSPEESMGAHRNPTGPPVLSSPPVLPIPYSK